MIVNKSILALPSSKGATAGPSNKIVDWSFPTAEGEMAVSSGPNMVIEYSTAAAESSGGLTISHHYVITGD